MNNMAPLPSRLAIEVVFDFVCPWCYLGIRRLGLLLARRPDLDVALNWRPFLLNPDMPRIGMPRLDYLIRKFGTEDRAKRLDKTIAELGVLEGIAFNFSKMKQTPDSVNAHRLIYEAEKVGVADRLVMHIFKAHFAEGQDIGNAAVLAGLAGQVGMDRRMVLPFLEQSEGVERVYADNLRAHRLGINGVPCFIVCGEHAISGAQESEILERLIDLSVSTAGEH